MAQRKVEVKAGYFRLGGQEIPRDLTGYDALVLGMHAAACHKGWIAELRSGGCEVFAHMPACYFRPDEYHGTFFDSWNALHADTEGGIALRDDTGRVVELLPGELVLDMGRFWKPLADAFVKWFIEEWKLPVLPPGPERLRPDGLFLDCTWDTISWKRGAAHGGYSFADPEAVDRKWKHGLGTFLTAIAFRLRRNLYKGDFLLYGNGMGHYRALDALCWEGWVGGWYGSPVRGAWTWLYNEPYGAGWHYRAYPGEAPMILPHGSGSSGEGIHNDNVVFAYACAKSFCMGRGDPIVFDNSGRILDLKEGV